MPLKYTARIDKTHNFTDPLSMLLPEALYNQYGDSGTYTCEILRWWSKDESQTREIKEPATMTCWGRYFNFKDDPLAQKHGFLTGDILEIMFLKKIDRRMTREGGLFRSEKWETTETDLFPARTVEERRVTPSEGRT